MWQLISDMMASPEDHADAYVWGAVLLAHFAIGLMLTAVIGGAWALVVRWGEAPRLTAWHSALLASVGYLLFWEGAQLIFFGADLADSLVDTAAAACGAVVAAGAWRNRGAAVAVALTLLAAIGVRGVGRRQ